MASPRIESTQTRLDWLFQQNREVAISFVFVELTAGLSSCQLVRHSQIMTTETKVRHLARATNAFQAAETAMWKVKMAHPEFDQMTALAERLRFELESLRRKNQPAGQRSEDDS